MCGGNADDDAFSVLRANDETTTADSFPFGFSVVPPTKTMWLFEVVKAIPT